MALYELTDLQVENLKALIMDSNIKGSAASAIVELINTLDCPVDEAKESDLHGEHNDNKQDVEDGT